MVIIVPVFISKGVTVFVKQIMTVKNGTSNHSYCRDIQSVTGSET